jgi:hypothetical protein
MEEQLEGLLEILLEILHTLRVLMFGVGHVVKYSK